MFLAGWNVDLQKGDNEATLTMTAPSATAEGFTGSGTVRFDLTSDTGETGELELPVSMLGINDADDFLAFAEAYMKGGDCSLWKDGGEVIVNSDIDLTGTPKSLYVNAGFSGVFNGANHTITYRIESNSGDAGIFQTIKGDGTVQEPQDRRNHSTSRMVTTEPVASPPTATAPRSRTSSLP